MSPVMRTDLVRLGQLDFKPNPLQLTEQIALREIANYGC